MKAVVAAFNQEKALVGAFSVLTNLRMELFQALNQEDGQLRLSHQKPVLKETFSEMEEANNFSLISSLNPGAGRVPQF